MRKITWTEVYDRLKKLPSEGTFYGIPRGGQIVAGLTGRAVDTPEEADYIIDDIVDSGKTYAQWAKMHEKPLFSLINKAVEGIGNEWVVFPWESDAEKDIQDVVVRQLQYLGEDCSREGLIDTPKRVVKSWNTLYGGYKENAEQILKTTFTQDSSEMVILKDIELYSTCEHHLLPIVGKCHIAYIPNGKVVGISKLARLLECYARRLQIQERLGNQIVEALEQYLKPLGCACIIEAQHFCMTSRGVQKQNSIMITSALKGVFAKEINTRQELLNLIRR